MSETIYTPEVSLSARERERVAEILGRAPTDVELQIFDLLWSEHCSYKSSRSTLSLLPTEGPTVIQGPGEDAGILRFAEWGGKSYAVVVAHESHNHPSQVVPVEGAATGIGGIVRDVICMGAEVIGVLDPLRFGDLRGPEGDRCLEIARGVVKGIADYANPLGVPNLGGDVCFDPSFDDNCLVNVVAVGLVEEDRILPSAVPAAAGEEPYSLVLVGKPTDGSGFGGATLASAILDESLEEKKGAVQVPDPFLKRVLNVALADLFRRAAERGIALGCKDLGAGGISCASSEIADRGGFGVEIDLDRVPLGEEIPPYVAAVSETQERYALAVPRSFVKETLELFNEEYELPSIYRGACAAEIGRFTREKQFRITSNGAVVCDALVESITCPVLERREAKAPPPSEGADPPPFQGDLEEALLCMLVSPNGGSEEHIFRSYDTEVQGRAVIRPGEGDAAVIVPVPGCPVGLAVTVDGNPWYGEIDPFAAGVHAVLEGARNLAAVGAHPIGMTDCLNYGNPEDPEVFHQFVEGVRGIREGACGVGLREDRRRPIPIVSGNVSFYNESNRGRAVAPSPILCLLGRVPHASRAITLGMKQEGSRIVLVGERYGELGGSLFYREVLGERGRRVPRIRWEEESGAIHLVSLLAEEGRIRAAHDISDGGLALALVEMLCGAREARLGARIDVGGIGGALGPAEKLFSESGGFLLEIGEGDEEEVLRRASHAGAPAYPLGSVVGGGTLTIEEKGVTLLRLPVGLARGARERALASVFTGV